MKLDWDKGVNTDIFNAHLRPSNDLDAERKLLLRTSTSSTTSCRPKSYRSVALFEMFENMVSSCRGWSPGARFQSVIIQHKLVSTNRFGGRNASPYTGTDT